ncbi:MAG TPA: tetratricopeptide repeat protein [Dactylosporangium sp.]|nr:tetratricopeptide repeat protein [Dactylosporangium sp.]
MVVALQGDPESGLRYQRRAYEEARRFGDGYFEPIVGNHLGQTLTLLGRTAEAAAEHERVLRDAGHRMPYEHAPRARGPGRGPPLDRPGPRGVGPVVRSSGVHRDGPGRGRGTPNVPATARWVTCDVRRAERAWPAW